MTTAPGVPATGHQYEVPPKNGLLGLIADYYESRGEEARSYVIRKGTLEEGVRCLMHDLTTTTQAYMAEQSGERDRQEVARLRDELASATRPFTAEMERLNARVTALNGIVERMRLAARGNAPISEVFAILREVPTVDDPEVTYLVPVTLEGEAESPWHPMSETPPKTGRYIVAHCGHAEIVHWLDPRKPWTEDTRTGWLSRLQWGPTHWMVLPDLERVDVQS